MGTSFPPSPQDPAETAREAAVQTPHITSHVMMVRPVRFGFNAQTAGDNAFQEPSRLAASEIQRLAREEFDTFVGLLRAQGVTVTVFDDTPVPHTPDSIFPNNWFSVHRQGQLILYPIYAPNRRAERRSDMVAFLQGRFPEGATLIDLSPYEQEGTFLEGTGSMIMDRAHQRIYACHSHRTDPALFDWFCKEISCEGYLFHAVDRQGAEIYHTNVMMALGLGFALVCLEAIHAPEERATLSRMLTETGHEVIPLSYEQMYQFAGNMLQLKDGQGNPLLVMSQRAHSSLRPDQLKALQQYTRLLVVPIDVIETCGGGSVRCMMAEVFGGEREDQAAN